jgi:hypothetical protein
VRACYVSLLLTVSVIVWMRMCVSMWCCVNEERRGERDGRRFVSSFWWKVEVERWRTPNSLFFVLIRNSERERITYVHTLLLHLLIK